MPKASKSTKGQIETRIELVSSMLVRGETRAKIVQDVTKKYGVQARMVDHYIARANAALAKAAEHRREVELGKAIIRLNTLYLKAGRVGDHKTQLAVQRELCTLLGLYPAGTASEGGAAYQIQLVEVRKP